MRKIIFNNDKYYHVYNRGVDKRDIFCDDKDYTRFIRSMREFNSIKPIGSLYEKDFKNRFGGEKLNSQRGIEFLNRASDDKESNSQGGIGFLNRDSGLVDIICYCLNLNHYHVILKQTTKKGIEKFMHKIGLGYTNYFNRKYNRSGSLFQGRFKAKHIDSVKYLAWLSSYINGNVEIHNIAKAKNCIWSSYQDYLNIRNGTLCHKQIVLEEFNNSISEYEEFTNMVISDSKEKKEDVKLYLADLEY